MKPVCPRCRGSLAVAASGLACGACESLFPVVAGIPDLRLRADPWIGLEEDRDKALRLEERVRHMPFEDAVYAYWEMTPSTPRERAERFAEHALRARRRSGEWLDSVGDDGLAGSPPWLDLGCGTGDLLAALAARRIDAIGADIALRWLVIARRRPELSAATLVCCGAEALPFAPESFGTVAALGLLEHCPDAPAVAGEMARVLRPAGVVRVRTVNRFAPVREPHVGVWGVGYIPRRWADSYVRRLSGQRYLHHWPRSPRGIQRALRGAGLSAVQVTAGLVLPSERERLPRPAAPISSVYDAGRRLPLARRVLPWIAPLLDARGVKP